TNRFAEEYLPLDLDNYVAITSYVHLPFYEEVLLEIPANWRQKPYYNLPIEEFMAIADKALLNGYTMVWSGDIGFDGGFNNNGFVMVKGEYQSEEKIGQWHRQSAFDRKTTQDDHGMHLVGFTYNKKGEKYYILKNSWGKSYGFKGIWYLSENYFRLRTIALTAHKDVLDLGE
ncbi:MAG: C1 family peptidase, partial [Bacteroidota bacterium]